ncbi:hypothetical protein [Ramlibacter rhizophilus]|uniref:Helix-turn-helix domain-containing protein n=1 Tax=Ramlibacter rhizophilus TaxID=1781167 RepID=A0A4Z0BVM9_9BURK|nr:hypothetical protein [Ramlibacter rhizophilus]TFZ03367.1 hypothetical protein EZ242_05650 [Ramlibacter rhizophilus]
MSGRHVGIVFTSSSHAGSELLVLACVAETLNDATGTWSISVGEIARRCKLSKRQAFRALAALRSSGELAIRKGGPGGKSVFTLMLERTTASGGLGWNKLGGTAPGASWSGAMAATQMTKVAEQEQMTKVTSPQSGCFAAGAPVTDELTSSSATADRGVIQPMTPASCITRHSDQTTTTRPVRALDETTSMVKALAAAGVAKVFVTAELREVIRLGASLQDVLDAITRSAHAANPFAYGVARLLNELQAASTPSRTGQRLPDAASDRDPALVKIERDALLATPVPAFVRELSRRLRQ